MAKQSKRLPAAALAVATAIAAYWYWSPLIVVHQMKEAVRVHDAAAFNSHVDYPALRENMKDQIAGKPDADAALGGIGRLLGGVVVDTLVQPATVMYVLEHGDFAKKHERGGHNGSGEGRGDGGSQGEDSDARHAWVTEREGVNRYIIRNDKTALVFVRGGFADWKLSELRF
ncbi:DUF2939 domain-containing protein [Massilia sp. SR12]